MKLVYRRRIFLDHKSATIYSRIVLVKDVVEISRLLSHMEKTIVILNYRIEVLGIVL